MTSLELDNYIMAWSEYCNGNTNIDKSHFLGLLSSRPSEDQLKKICQFIPESELVLERISNVFKHTLDDNTYIYVKPNPKKNNDKSEPVKILKQFIESQKEFLMSKNIDENTRLWFKDFNCQPKFVELDEVNEVILSNCNYDRLIVAAEHEFNEYRKDLGLRITSGADRDYRIMSGIKEALYGLNNDYRLYWYIISPLLTTKINYQLYFDFWKTGKRYAITKTDCLISNAHSNSTV